MDVAQRAGSVTDHHALIPPQSGMITRSKRSSTLWTGLLAAGAAALAAVGVLKLWNVDLRIPFQTFGDAIFHVGIIKGMLDHGWALSNPSLGAPGILDLRYFPAIDNVSLLLLKILSYLINDPALLLNLFYILTFPMIAASGAAVARSLRLSASSSFLVGVLYAFLPYHLLRHVGHLFLASYAVVPIAILLALRLFERESLRSSRRALIFTLLAVLIVGSSGPYYPIFAAGFVVAAGVFASLAHRTFRPLVKGLLTSALIIATMLVNFSPSIIAGRRDPMVSGGKRTHGEAEFYGLKFAQLVLPARNHRLPAFAEVGRRYAQAPMVNENGTSTLGLIGSAGFLLLLFWLPATAMRNRAGVVRRMEPAHSPPSQQDHHHDLFSSLSVLTLFGFLVGTVGGIGSVMALLITPQVRAYNRISVFLAYLSLLAAGLVLDRLSARFSARRVREERGIAPRHLTPWVVALALVAFGIVDQSGRGTSYRPRDPGFESLPSFVQAIERSVPAGSMIAQLPYFPFPENGKVAQVGDYDHLRPYLFSRQLRWSYGSVKNSGADLWQEQSFLIDRETLPRLALAGFGGVYIDRRGWPDRGAALENSLAIELERLPIRSGDGRYLFFDLGPYAQKLRGTLGPDWTSASDRARYPLLLAWGQGCDRLESDVAETWRWCGSSGTLRIENGLKRNRPVIMEMRVASGVDNPATLWVTGSLWKEVISIPTGGTLVRRSFTIPPGHSFVRLRTDAEPLTAVEDSRALNIRITGFQLRELEISAAAPRAPRVTGSTDN